MSKIKKTSQSSKTRSRRERFYNQYNKIAKSEKIRFNYDLVRRLDKKSKQQNISFKKTFEDHLKKRNQDKIYYIQHKYNVDKIQAKNILNEHLDTGKRYEQIRIVYRQINHFESAWVALVNTFRDMAEKDRFININMELPSGQSFRGSSQDFLNEVPLIRSQFNFYLLDAYSQVSSESPDQWVIEDIFTLDYNDFITDATSVDIGTIDLNSWFS